MAVMMENYHIKIKSNKIEIEFKDFFNDCEVGAQPPFGNLYNMEVFVAEKLTEDENIAFREGDIGDKFYIMPHGQVKVETS